MRLTDYKDRYTREHYDRLCITFPKGFKETVQRNAAQNQVSVSAYLYRLVCEDTRENGQSKLAAFSRLDLDQLKRWQIPAKYFEMIQAVTRTEDGYTLELKPDYVNDLSGDRVIRFRTTKEIRKAITGTHRIYKAAAAGSLDDQTMQQLKRWQVPKKYYPMIESITVDKAAGHTVTLQPGYVNAAAGGRVIRFRKANDIRTLMQQTRPE